MTSRIALTLILALAASACAVYGEEEEPGLEEIEASFTSKAGFDVDDVTLYRDGKEISYDSLSRWQREGLHATLDALEAETPREASIIPWCTFGSTGWACWNDLIDCGCQYAPSGWKCYCDTDP